MQVMNHTIKGDVFFLISAIERISIAFTQHIMLTWQKIN